MKPMVYTKHLGKDRHKLEMAPLVDVVFQLLIFFLVATQVRPTEADFTSNLPPASGPANPIDTERKEQVDIYLRQGSSENSVVIHLGRNTSSPIVESFAALRDRLANSQPDKTTVVIDGDPEIKFSFITQTLDAVMGAGVEQVTFAKPQDANR